MPNKKPLTLISLGGIIMIFSIGILMANPQPVNAQCGSQSSSCKNCHEVQGEDPVNNDGTDWHQPHAFGDFCEFCHAGNVQSAVKTEAHTGMVAPLSNVEIACSGCHGDYMELAEGYASTLGVEIGVGGGPTSGGSDSSATSPPSQEDSAQSAACITDTAIDYDQSDLIDYTHQYEETVLGIRDLNKGNLILGILIIGMVFGGGLFVSLNEGWVTISTKSIPDTIDGFAADNVALLPQIEKIDPKGRQALKKLLKKPEKAANIFKAVADIEE